MNIPHIRQFSYAPEGRDRKWKRNVRHLPLGIGPYPHLHWHFSVKTFIEKSMDRQSRRPLCQGNVLFDIW